MQVRADLSVRHMLRVGLIEQADEFAMLDALDDVTLDDREHARRLQDALVLHALDSTSPRDLYGLSEDDFMEVLRYAITRLTPQPAEADEDDAEAEDLEAEAEPVEEPVEDALARMDATPSTESVMPASAKVLDELEEPADAE